MLFDIKLIKSPPMFCLESGAASIARWLNRNFEMMFCRMWGFDFLPENTDYPGVIGKRITPGFSDSDQFEPFEIYHGIRIDFQRLEQVDTLVNSIKNELQKGMPAVVYFNRHCFPWVKREPNMDSFGAILIIGYEQDTFFCLDIHNNLQEIKSLPIDNILKLEPLSNNNYFYLYYFSIVGDERKNITYDDFIMNFKKTGLDRRNTFESMRNLAECIRVNLDFNREKCNSDSIYYIPLLINFTHITRARKLISQTLDFIWKKTNNPLSFNLSMGFLEMGDEWYQVWSMLNKLYYFQENNNLRIRIANKINEIADKEEIFINKIINNEYRNKFVWHIQRENHFEDKVSDNILLLDIKEYMNNKAFACDESNAEGANFTGQGEFFIRKGLPENNLLNVAGMKFLINPENLYDNISCLSQNIVLPRGSYKRLMFLGCCEWGERYGDLDIIYWNGKIEKTLFYLPDWYEKNTDIIKAWTGQIIFNNCLEERYLFAVSYLLNNYEEIAQIILPEIPNMHIFAISLERCS